MTGVSFSDVRHLTAAAIRTAGRRAAERAIRNGGERVARLDRRPAHRRLIIRAIPEAVRWRFHAEAAEDLDATFELRVRDPFGGEPDRFGVRVVNGTCAVQPGPTAAAGAGITIGADDMIRLISGAVGWPSLLASHRLELSGDPFLAIRFPNLFGLPPTATGG